MNTAQLQDLMWCHFPPECVLLAILLWFYTLHTFYGYSQSTGIDITSNLEIWWNVEQFFNYFILIFLGGSKLFLTRNCYLTVRKTWLKKSLLHFHSINCTFFYICLFIYFLLFIFYFILLFIFLILFLRKCMDKPLFFF